MEWRPHDDLHASDRDSAVSVRAEPVMLRYVRPVALPTPPDAGHVTSMRLTPRSCRRTAMDPAAGSFLPRCFGRRGQPGLEATTVDRGISRCRPLLARGVFVGVELPIVIIKDAANVPMATTISPRRSSAIAADNARDPGRQVPGFCSPTRLARRIDRPTCSRSTVATLTLFTRADLASPVSLSVSDESDRRPSHYEEERHRRIWPLPATLPSFASHHGNISRTSRHHFAPQAAPRT